MGNIRFGKLPRSRKWTQVRYFLKENKPPHEIAAAALLASENRLHKVLNDQGFQHAYAFLLEFITEFNSPSFFESTASKPLRITNNASFLELTSSLSRHLSNRLSRFEVSTNVSEMANLAVIETITAIVRKGHENLVETNALTAQGIIQDFYTKNNFAGISREFISRFLSRYILFFLSKELPLHVGDGRRFTNTNEHSDFVFEIKTTFHKYAQTSDKTNKEWAYWDDAMVRSPRIWNNAAPLLKYSFTKLFVELTTL